MSVNSESTRNHRSSIRRMAVVFAASAALVGGAGAMATTASADPDCSSACGGSLNLAFGSNGWDLGSLNFADFGSLNTGSSEWDFGSGGWNLGSLFDLSEWNLGSLFGSGDFNLGSVNLGSVNLGSTNLGSVDPVSTGGGSGGGNP
ncbi:hypothetical protein BDB13_4341 [Rhodococcus sp. OK302]|nr:hypothetical protein BDB13_4341 [Rhodococcus sp. OK302]